MGCETLASNKANEMTLTKLHFVNLLSDRLGLSRPEAATVVESVFDEILTALVDDRDVKLANFGTFSARHKTARPGRNPRTGQQYLVSARRVVTFVPAPHLRDSVAGFKDETPEAPEQKVA